MPVSGLALIASTAVRAASLNLCTDEYLLMLAKPGEIISVSHLARDPNESVLWRRARQYRANSGSLEGALSGRPTIVFTMGGGGRASAAIAHRLNIRMIDLPYPASVGEVEQQAVSVAAALGDRRRADGFRMALAQLRSTAPRRLQDAAFLSAGGLSLAAGSLGAEWMGLAGFRQRRLPGGRLTLETLVTTPPAWLIRSDYRAGQWSRGQAWTNHPLVRRLQSRMLGTDVRAWTCGGMPMVAEVSRLRKLGR
jgi:iron complex transport system substrate-binding protein